MKREIVWPALVSAGFLVGSAMLGVVGYVLGDPLAVGLSGVYAVTGIGWAILAGRA